METHKIEAHKITKPIQLMAVWFVALLLIDTAFLTAATKINSPAWLAPSLVISAIAFVPLFLAGVFLMQTVFRKELQDDPFYSEWLKRQEETFEDFAPENVPVNSGINVNISGSANITAGRDIAIAEEDLKIRGPGELLGLSQHGLDTTFKVADLIRDLALMKAAARASGP